MTCSYDDMDQANNQKITIGSIWPQMGKQV